MNIDSKKFKTMGFGTSKKTTSSYESYIRFSTVVESADKAFGELGMFGSNRKLGSSTFSKVTGTVRGTGRAIGTGSRFVRDTGQFAKMAIDKFFKLVKAIIGGFVEMVQQTILDLGNQTSNMEKMANDINKIKNNLLPYIENEEDRKRIQGLSLGEQIANVREYSDTVAGGANNNSNSASGNGAESYSYRNKKRSRAYGENDGANINNVRVANVNDNITFSFPTVESFNMAGWYLGVENVSHENRSPMGTFMTLVNAGKADGTLDLSVIRDEATLYDFLQESFMMAYTNYERSPLFQRFNLINRNHKSIISMLSNLRNIRYSYTHISPEGYGQYVAQSLSPAGAFATFKKESLESKNDRRKIYESFLTPQTVTNIPGTRAVIELIRVLHYVSILLGYLAGSDVISFLKKKIEALKKLRVNIDRMANMTVGQLVHAKRNHNLQVRSNYGGNQDGGRGTRGNNGNLNYTDMYDMNGNPIGNFTQAGNVPSGSSFIPDELYEELGLDPYGENQSMVNGEYVNIQRQSGADNNLESQYQVSRAQHNALGDEKDGYIFGEINRTGDLKNRQMRLREHQMTPNIIKFGMKYLQQLLVSMGNLTFQEGRFFNNACKVLLNSCSELLEAVDDIESAFSQEGDSGETLSNDAVNNNNGPSGPDGGGNDSNSPAAPDVDNNSRSNDGLVQPEPEPAPNNNNGNNRRPSRMGRFVNSVRSRFRRQSR